jgi:hypothetical protein
MGPNLDKKYDEREEKEESRVSEVNCRLWELHVVLSIICRGQRTQRSGSRPMPTGNEHRPLQVLLFRSVHEYLPFNL